jgi:hypothetical protein
LFSTGGKQFMEVEAHAGVAQLGQCLSLDFPDFLVRQAKVLGDLLEGAWRSPR